MSYSDTESQQVISIRTAGRDDHAALRRVAERDSATVPEGPVLLAAVDGEIRAAISLVDLSRAIADPFRPTTGLLALLRLEAAERGLADNSQRPSSGSQRRGRGHRTALRGALAWR